MSNTDNLPSGSRTSNLASFGPDSWPAVTIVLPVFNGKSTIRCCLDSIFGQTFHNWKLLAVDDGSTDGSADYLQSLHDRRLTILKNSRNKGLYPTLNMALPQVDTEWSALVFQDDELTPEYLEDFMKLAIKHPGADFFWGGVNIYREAENRIIPGIDTYRQELIQPSHQAWESILERGTIWTISGSFSRTRTLQRYGFREDLPHCADFEFLLRAIRASTFLYYEHPLVTIRIHQGQASSSNLSNLADIKERSRIFSEQLMMFKLTRRTRWRFARQLFWSGLARAMSRLKRRDLGTGAMAVLLTFQTVKTVLGTKPSPRLVRGDGLIHTRRNSKSTYDIS